jgi:2,4-dienoyl-CoA reductase-like NADH-dependent reductase (Old Yellow Enzyme family)/thioredoxin reductase
MKNAIYTDFKQKEWSVSKMKNNFPHLFQPLKVNSIMLKNRIFSSPMGMPTHHKVLSTTYYGNVSLFDKSAGGAAVVFGGAEAFADDNCEYPKYSRDEMREALSVMRQYGAKAAKGVMPHKRIDLSRNPRDMFEVFGAYAPSPYMTRTGKLAIEMTKADIQEMLQEGVKEAIAAKNFGFDMLYCGAVHESLAAQFLSPAFNKRTDEYGGSLENRMRFAIEHVRTIRENIGPDFPIVFAVSASHFLKNSFEFEDILALIGEVKDMVDLIHVTAGLDVVPGYFQDDPIIDTSLGLEAWYWVNGKHCQSIFEPPMTNVHWAAKVKEKYPDKLVSVNGSITTPQDAEEIIAKGWADAVVLGRPLNADPYFGRKAQEGRSEDIVPCLRCLYCYHSATIHTNTQCSVNPRYRRENRVPLELGEAKLKKRVVIIGAGPAGCKAALTAHERGHEVILLEKSGEIGGQIKYSQYEKIKIDLQNYWNYLKVQIQKNKIDIRYNTTATREMIQELKPDALIIAIGASPIKPVIQGSEGEHVHQVLDIYPTIEKLGKKVTVIGGGLVGAEFAYELLERGHEVTIVEMTDKLAAQGNFLYRIGLLKALEEHAAHLTILKNTTCQEIHGSRVIAEQDGERKEIAGDDVVMAVGMKANKEEAFGFYGIADETFMVGDCEKVGKVLEATNDSYFIAANL